jgi:transcriptional regulator with XRE-family HTH domain
MNLKPFLEANGVKQVELVDALGLDSSTVSLKLSGDRRWFQEEVDRVLAFLTQRLGRPVTYEEAFAGKAA